MLAGADVARQEQLKQPLAKESPLPSPEAHARRISPIGTPIQAAFPLKLTQGKREGEEGKGGKWIRGKGRKADKRRMSQLHEHGAEWYLLLLTTSNSLRTFAEALAEQNAQRKEERDLKRLASKRSVSWG